ncbi:MAG TPA: potassium channel family protein [Propionibacteriaceae bacterium]|nr:potassium channel family protein [Propionibacteriaceae bacterium]
MRRTVVRALLTSAALVVLYYRLPMTGALDTAAIARLVVGLLVFTVLIAWQVRAILRSAYPALGDRDAGCRDTAVPTVVRVDVPHDGNAQAHAFTEPLSKTNALYFTVTVFATVGFGDITPKTEATRVATIVQMIADLVAVGLVPRLVTLALFG